jgi:hypothetical protein
LSDISECEQLSDLSPLTGLTSLRTLNLSWASQLSDLSALANLPSLKINSPATAGASAHRFLPEETREFDPDDRWWRFPGHRRAESQITTIIGKVLYFHDQPFCKCSIFCPRMLRFPKSMSLLIAWATKSSWMLLPMPMV